MSCEHGEWSDCERCAEIESAYVRGYAAGKADAPADTLKNADSEKIRAALKVAKDLAALVGKQDHLIDYDAVSRGRKVIDAAIAAIESNRATLKEGGNA